MVKSQLCRGMFVIRGNVGTNPFAALLLQLHKKLKGTKTLMLGLK